MRYVQYFIVLPDLSNRFIDHRATEFLKIAPRTLCRLNRDDGGKTCILFYAPPSSYAHGYHRYNIIMVIYIVLVIITITIVIITANNGGDDTTTKM